MNVIIIEDEKLAAIELEELLHACDPSVQVLAKIDSVKGAVEWLEQQACDLIFLDIHLADDNGFRIFERIEVNTPVVFTTAYDQYALHAFTTNSIDYLLKPVEQDKLSTALKKYRNMRNLFGEELVRLLESYTRAGSQYQKKFMVHSGERMIPVPAGDIAYFFAQQRYVVLFTRKNEQYVIDYTLDKLEQMLDPQLFFRINRQFIISAESITGMTPHTKSRVKLDLLPPAKEDVIVSVDRSPRFKQWVNR